MNNKVKYLLRSSFNIFSDTSCPYCGSQKTKRIDRKYLVTSLLKCLQCQFQFRHPKDSPNLNKTFYQLDYQEKDGITTDLPNGQRLKELIQSQFKLGNKNADRYSQVIRSLFKNKTDVNILDYGCSWGYTSYQFKKAGFEVVSFEISESRAKYGNDNLGLEIFTNYKDIQTQVDVFFSAHVIEHHPNIKQMLENAKHILNPGGYFIAYCPNGSAIYRKNNPTSFHKAWGLVHPSYLSVDFFQKVFSNYPYVIGSDNSSLDQLFEWDQASQLVLDLSGVELFVICKMN